MFGLMTLKEHAHIVAQLLESERALADRRVTDAQGDGEAWKTLAKEALAELKALRTPPAVELGELQTEKLTTRDADTKAAQKAKQGAKRG